MMRLIDADELLNIPIRVTGEIPIKNGHVQPIEAISVREIENAPTIDPESLRPRGEWLEGKVLEKCSICGKKGFPNWHYCPNCGAIMDLKEEETE